MSLKVSFQRKNEAENRNFAYAKTKAQTGFAVTAKLISAFVFASRIAHFLSFLNPKFQASSLQVGLCQAWSETPKTGILASRL